MSQAASAVLNREVLSKPILGIVGQDHINRLRIESITLLGTCGGVDFILKVLNRLHVPLAGHVKKYLCTS